MARMEFDEAKLLRTMLHALRHNPLQYGLELDSEGWARSDDLLLAMRVLHFRWDSLEWRDMESVISASGLGRLDLRDGRIRATYGHSVALGSVPEAAIPSPVLFHGTSVEVLSNIAANGLKPMGRRFVHLTADHDYAFAIANVRETGVVILVQAQQAHQAGISFHRANEHVWLTTEVPPMFVSVPNQVRENDGTSVEVGEQ